MAEHRMPRRHPSESLAERFANAMREATRQADLTRSDRGNPRQAELALIQQGNLRDAIRNARMAVENTGTVRDRMWLAALALVFGTPGEFQGPIAAVEANAALAGQIIPAFEEAMTSIPVPRGRRDIVATRLRIARRLVKEREDACVAEARRQLEKTTELRTLVKRQAAPVPTGTEVGSALPRKPRPIRQLRERRAAALREGDITAAAQLAAAVVDLGGRRQDAVWLAILSCAQEDLGAMSRALEKARARTGKHSIAKLVEALLIQVPSLNRSIGLTASQRETIVRAACAEEASMAPTHFAVSAIPSLLEPKHLDIKLFPSAGWSGVRLDSPSPVRRLGHARELDCTDRIDFLRSLDPDEWWIGQFGGAPYNVFVFAGVVIAESHQCGNALYYLSGGERHIWRRAFALDRESFRNKYGSRGGGRIIHYEDMVWQKEVRRMMR
jgi:hypothetical protein